MNDLISRQAAIEAIARTAREKFNLSDEFNHYLAGLMDGENAIRQLPSAQTDVPDTNVGDTISRKAAIEAIDGALLDGLSEGTAIEILSELPSAQPERTCDTCKYNTREWDEDPCDGCTGAESKYEPDNGWIPVSERLPEDGKNCLVTEVITNGMKSVLIAKFANDLYKIDKYDFARRKGEHGWFCYDYEHGHCYDVDVLAWMPLPDPYKEDA